MESTGNKQNEREEGESTPSQYTSGPATVPGTATVPGLATDIDRRDFLRVTSAGAAFALAGKSGLVFAAPLFRPDFEKLVPEDKKLSPEWIRALQARGGPVKYAKSRDEFRYLGMPVGGLFAGHLYLGGDGRLWHWDIFNQFIYTDDRAKCHYSQPFMVESPIAQGFSLIIGDKTIPLDSTGVEEITFRGEYPIATIDYIDRNLPLGVELQAFSPFVPLNTLDSSLPVTVMEFTLRNHSNSPIAATLRGNLENGVCLHHRNIAGVLRNRVIESPGITQMVFSAEPATGSTFNGDADWLTSLPDFGTMSLALIRGADVETSGDVTANFGEKLIGSVSCKLELPPNESRQVTFLIAWHFPNLSIHDSFADCGRHYASRFKSASHVVEYVSQNFPRLATETRLWRDTWYDSSLPFWFLDRTFLNTSILATSTSYRLFDGRYYGWEGVGNCQGTCGHVYGYAHAAARLFPELERDLHERVDFGLAQMPDGAIHFRGEFNDIPAIDAQSGYVLRALREHQMSVDDQFLRRNWPKIKLAMQWLINKDADGDGLIESNQHNTLDTDWFGKVSWLSGLYLAALTAAAQMADEVDDGDFATSCRTILDAGRKNIVEQLFEQGYFINSVDKAHLDSINSGTGCEIDQVMGQSWAFQVGLPRVFPQKETLSALRSLWRYNFTPDAGVYREVYKPGRWYAMPGEAGLLMCTFPRTDWDYSNAKGEGPEWASGYFNECMVGFEYQVASHMIWEGVVEEGLSVFRAVHDRYQPSKRNPWNEIECGDHYARSMASYGVFLAACGFEYHGPLKHIGFAPRLSPEDFRSAFTSAEGWGTYSQQMKVSEFQAEIAVKWGKLAVKTIALEVEHGSSVHVTSGGKILASQLKREGKRVRITLSDGVEIAAGESLHINVS
jgi:non-lysosomal glucosylceramidase